MLSSRQAGFGAPEVELSALPLLGTTPSILATAGNQEKRDFLHTLGIEHAMNSRSLDFADEVLEATDGRGVDVVLNSVSGEMLEHSFELMAPYGRFIEIGKRDIDSNRGLPMRA